MQHSSQVLQHSQCSIILHEGIGSSLSTFLNQHRHSVHCIKISLTCHQETTDTTGGQLPVCLVSVMVASDSLIETCNQKCFTFQCHFVPFFVSQFFRIQLLVQCHRT